MLKMFFALAALTLLIDSACTNGARSFVATIEQGMRELEHRGSMSAAACGAVVAEDAAADPRNHRT